MRFDRMAADMRRQYDIGERGQGVRRMRLLLVDVKTGDHVSQKAYWDADAGDATAKKFSKAYGGDAYSNGDQSSKSGYDTSKVYANTKAYQTNDLLADQHQEVVAGIGGNGGNGNAALGGDVHFDFDTKSAHAAQRGVAIGARGVIVDA